MKERSFGIIDTDKTMYSSIADARTKSLGETSQSFGNIESISSEGDISSILAGISKDSMLQGLVYSEIFGMPKCRRRGR